MEFHRGICWWKLSVPPDPYKAQVTGDYPASPTATISQGHVLIPLWRPHASWISSSEKITVKTIFYHKEIDACAERHSFERHYAFFQKVCLESREIKWKTHFFLALLLLMSDQHQAATLERWHGCLHVAISALASSLTAAAGRQQIFSGCQSWGIGQED